MTITIEMPVNKGNKWTLNEDKNVIDGFREFLNSLTFKGVLSNLPSVKAAADPIARCELADAITIAFRTNARPADKSFKDDMLFDTITAEVARVCEGVQAGKFKVRGKTKADRAPVTEWTGPVIQIDTGEIEAAVDASERALRESGRGLYQRGGIIVSIGGLPNPMDGASELAIFEEVEAGIHEHIAASARFESYNAKADSYTRCNPPTWLAKTLAARRGRLTLPGLTAVIDAPTMRPDGSILDIEGYDPMTGLLLDYRGKMWPVVEISPSQADARAALDVMIDLIKTFPFVSPADRSVALACMLSAVVRRSLRTCPMFAFTSPTPGSGKGKLVSLAAIMVQGRKVATMNQGQDDAEDDKRIAAALMAGKPVMSIDNIRRPLYTDTLCSMLTEQIVSCRVLGKSLMLDLPATALMMATGTNLTLKGDMDRRVLNCRLDPLCERPEERAFDSDPVETMLMHRGEYVVAALTVLRAFFISDATRQSVPLGSFEDWSQLVRDSLIWLGEPDPCDVMKAARAENPELEVLHSIIAQWGALIGTAKVTAHGIISVATQRAVTGYGEQTQHTNAEFREALLTVAGDGGAVSGRRLGKWLAANQNRILDGHRISKAGISAGMMTWKLEAA